MIKKLIACFILFVWIILSACHATPQDLIIKKKGNDLADLVIATQESNPFENIPQEISSKIVSDDKRIIINIDATIVVPDIDCIPVAKLTPRSFTQNEIETVAYTLLQNNELLEPRKLEDYSKEEIEERILNLKSGKDSDLYLENPEQYHEEIKDELEMYEQLYQKAPTESVRKPASIELRPSLRDESAMTVAVSADLGKSEPAYFTYIDKQTKIVNFAFYNVEGIPPTGKVTENFNVPGVTISRDEAILMVKELVDKLNLGAFSINGMGTIPYIGTSRNVFGYDDLPKCYIFYLTREISGLNDTYVNPSFIQLQASQPSEKYNYVWPCEVIEVTVDDTGILSVLYRGPIADIEMINDNVGIESFEKIINIFEKQVCFAGAFPKEKDITEIRIEIKKIVLGATRIINRDSFGSYLYVPTWDFFGSVTSRYKEGAGDQGQINQDNEFTEDDYGYSILTINAIDGSVIDRNLGY